jgi:hypothetical protein
MVWLYHEICFNLEEFEQTEKYAYSLIEEIKYGIEKEYTGIV